jgi:hypothetical protein
MAKKRAFVKYTKQGRLIPGSLIVTTSGGYPINGLYQEVPMDLCCLTTTVPPVSLFKFDTSTTGSVGSCLAKADPISIYMTQECYDLIPVGQSAVGCDVWLNSSGTIPATNGWYLAIVESNKPGLISISGGKIVEVKAC